MSVMDSRYLSALGNILCSLCVIILLSAAAGCDKKQTPSIPEERFQQIYGDILFLGELYRNDSTALRTALDSLLEANDIDTSILFATARQTAVDREQSAELYRVVIERFEKRSQPQDSLSPEAKAAADSISTPVKPRAPYLK